MLPQIRLDTTIFKESAPLRQSYYLLSAGISLLSTCGLVSTFTFG